MCPVCKFTRGSPLHAVNGYDIHVCDGCGHGYVWPMPGSDELVEHYNQASYFEGDPSQGYEDYSAMHKALRPHFLQRLKRLSQFKPSKGRLLDFGCADGYFLSLAQQAGWQVVGVELSSQMRARAKAQLDAPVHASLDALSSERFDAICLWEVIEHVPAPATTLGGLVNLLAPGGTLALSTPNNGHWQALRAKAKWVAYRPPSHLQYFTFASLEHCLHGLNTKSTEVSRTMPLPEVPAAIDRSTRELQARLASGQSDSWRRDLWMWRLIRLAAMGVHRLLRPREDIYTTLVAYARRG
jgi:2-polyprenyl-3-methyl-5-hydroxy-6-metoxy-1,4-benzoquinol methylase